MTGPDHHHEGGAHSHLAAMARADPWLAAMWAFVRRHLSPAPATVIEIGCGSSGGFVPELERVGYAATGVDPEAPTGDPYVRERFEDATLSPADVVVASTSLHHVHDLGQVLDRVRALLRPGGTVVVVEWAWERFDQRTAQWCFDRLDASSSDDAGWLHRHRDRWSASGLAWFDCLQGWAEGEGLHRGESVVAGLDERFERVSLEYGPYFFPDLEGTTEADEAAAIAAGEVHATGVRYVGTCP